MADKFPNLTDMRIDLSEIFARMEDPRPDLAPLLKELKALIESNPSPEELAAATNALRGLSVAPIALDSQRKDQHIHRIFYAALDPILDCSSMDVVSSISQLSTYFRAYVKNYLVRRVNATVSQWFSKPILLRDAMRFTGTVISGSTALAFAVGADWESNDLDLWTPRGSVRKMVKHLVRVEGYTVTKRYEFGVEVEVGILGDEEAEVDVGGGDDPVMMPLAPMDGTYRSNQIRSVTKLSKMIYSKRQGVEVPKFVDVVESCTEHAIAPILRFHSSIVMNWITADSVVLTYPKLTFASLAIVNERIYMSDRRQATWREKYAERGIQFLADTSRIPGGCGAACPAVWRSTKDVGCMTVHFGDAERMELDEPDLQWAMSKATGNLYGGARRKCYNPFCPRYLTMLRRRDGLRPDFQILEI